MSEVYTREVGLRPYQLDHYRDWVRQARKSHPPDSWVEFAPVNQSCEYCQSPLSVRMTSGPAEYHTLTLGDLDFGLSLEGTTDYGHIKFRLRDRFLTIYFTY